MSKVIVTMAIGDSTWGNMALNLALSIKANSPEQKTALIYTDGAIRGIEQLCGRFFDYAFQISHDSESQSSIELSFKSKPELYDMVLSMVPDAKQVIFMDADTLVAPGKNVSEWFDEHSDKDFTSYCNDMYYYATQTRKRKDYTFWCDPEIAKKYFGLHPSSRLPQVNSSFLYWTVNERAKLLFDTAKELWECQYEDIQQYRGEKPDEFCFNIACAITGVYPHRNTYRPIYFTCFSEDRSTEYIYHYFRAFGFAGTGLSILHLEGIYNDCVRYYRQHFGIFATWEFKVTSKAFADTSPIAITPIKKKTLYRAGELPNSDAGVFNPDAILTNGGRLLVIMRKEPSMDAYRRYSKSSAIPCLLYEANNNEQVIDMSVSGFLPGERIEDFRMFYRDGDIICNHHVVTRNHTPEMEVKVFLSLVYGNDFVKIGEVKLPIEVSKVEKNWVFFSEGKSIYCIYSLFPYRMFVSHDIEKWEEVSVSGEIDFVHKGMISNSTNPIFTKDGYLMFFHTKEMGVYYHGAVLIDAETKSILHYTKHSISLPARNDGMHKGLHYISGCVLINKSNAVRVFYGENDSHACYVDYDYRELINAIKNENS